MGTRRYYGSAITHRTAAALLPIELVRYYPLTTHRKQMGTWRCYRSVITHRTAAKLDFDGYGYLTIDKADKVFEALNFLLIHIHSR